MKKLLALVLALVMTLSLCTVSNAAYSDAADVDYDEAVAVMSAVGVFQGADGKFSPKAELTREQAAKLIAYLDLGEATAEALPAVKVFNDVEANRWSAKYVAYCADAGYLAGVGDNNFDPAGKLTGYAFGKMLLCVLGYDAAIEGFTGANWQIAVAKLMQSNDIAKSVAAAASATLTREAAAQYCLNTLKADMVEYASKGTNITINGAVIATGASKAEVVTATAGTPANIAISADRTGTPAKDIIQLGEKLYEGKLSLKPSDKDAYGRPAYKWYNGKPQNTTNLVGTYTDKAGVVITANVKDLAALNKLVTEAGFDKFTAITDTVKTVKNFLAAAATTNTTDTVASLIAQGNGIVIELFNTNPLTDNILDTAVLTVPTASTVTVTNKLATKAKGAYTTYTVGVESGIVYTSHVDAAAENDTAVVPEGLKTGDVVLAYRNDAGKLVLTVPETVTGTVTSKSSTGVYTVDGAAMKKAIYFNAGISTDVTVNSKVSATLYVDEFGYIVGVKAGAAQPYAYVLKTGTVNTLVGTDLNAAATATLVLADGTVTTVKTVDANGDSAAYTAASSKVAGATVRNGVVTYSVNADGTYTLTPVAMNNTVPAVQTVTQLDKTKTALQAGAVSMYAGANTLFVYANYNPANGKLTGDVTTVTGIKNINTAALTGGERIYAVDTTTGGDKVADVVYVFTDVNATAVSKFVFLTGDITDNGTNNQAVKVFVNGKEDTIVLTDVEAAKIPGTYATGLYSQLTVTGKAITATAPARALTSDGVTPVTGMKVVGNLLYTTTAAGGDTGLAIYTGGVYDVADNCVVYDIDTTDVTCTAVEGEANLVGAVYTQLNTAGDAIIAIYVVHA